MAGPPKRSVRTSNSETRNQNKSVTKVEASKPQDEAVEDGKESAAHAEAPPLLHRFQHDASILCLTTVGERIFAGTQNGELLVFTRDTYQRQYAIQAHNGSVLGLCLSEDQSLLFSSAGDREVNIWDTSTLKNVATLISAYDVGDIFCLSYSSRSHIVYMGCQNTSIQWHDLSGYESQPSCDVETHPSVRKDRFFDSPGPGGIRDPRQYTMSRGRVKTEARYLEVPREQIHQFAHYGYVHTMMLMKDSPAEDTEDEILITGGGDGAVRLWLLETSKKGAPSLLAHLEDGRQNTESILSIGLGGQFLFTGRTNGEVNVWDLETRQLLRVLKPFDGDILSLTLGPSGLFVLSGDGQVKTYNPQYESTQAWYAHQGKILASTHSSSQSGNFLITGSSDNTIAIWKNKDMKPVQTKADLEDELIESLRTFIAFRTVSSDPRYKADCRRGASWLRSLLRRFGATTEIFSTSGQCNPIVLAKFGNGASSGQGKKRILFYGHYDVIAAEDRQGLWVQDPFTMTGRDGYLYGRGATDNKGPIMAAAHAVADALHSQQLKSEIIFLIEGEEESGSRGFEEAVRKHKHLIGDVDWILVANSYWLDDEVPCLTYGLRGVLHATVHVDNDLPDLHSGVDGSRILDEPLKDLVALISSLTGPKGQINIPGFDDAIIPLTEGEKRLYDEVSKSLIARNPGLGSQEALSASLMRRWRDASLTIHGFKTSGSEKSTIIPHSASVALSMRLVPNQESRIVSESLRRYLTAEFKQLGTKNFMTVRIDHTAEPWLGDPNNDIYKTLEEAIKTTWTDKNNRRNSASALAAPAINPSHVRHRPSRTSTARPTTPATSSTLATGGILTSPHAESDVAVLSPIIQPSGGKTPPLQSLDLSDSARTWRPLYIREGGSIGAIRFLEKEFSAPAAQFPCGQASDNAHLDNERLRVLNLLNARDIFRQVFVGLSSS